MRMLLQVCRSSLWSLPYLTHGNVFKLGTIGSGKKWPEFWIGRLE